MPVSISPAPYMAVKFICLATDSYLIYLLVPRVKPLVVTSNLRLRLVIHHELQILELLHQGKSPSIPTFIGTTSALPGEPFDLDSCTL